MNGRGIVKVGVLSLALALGASVSRPSGLQASGYMLTVGGDGAVVGEPGGAGN